MEMESGTTGYKVPVIDVSALLTDQGDKIAVARKIGQACRENGFFYISNHGISTALQKDLARLSLDFFALEEDRKMDIRMELGGKAWRGYFPVKGELTSGKPDLKEGLYFGTELDETHPHVQSGTPMHGRNLFPEDFPALKTVVLAYMEAMTQLGHRLMEGLSLSLGMDANYFKERFTSDPLTLFRIFHYPPETHSSQQESPWGVGEHTDYGVLTILKQDDAGGLQVKSNSGWIDAPFIEGTFVCNIGDMLDRMTGGIYRSTPHRVRNVSGKGRLSFPFFFDPNFDAIIEALPIAAAEGFRDEPSERWDNASVHEFEGTYGDYVLSKVSKVFPQLRKDVTP